MRVRLIVLGVLLVAAMLVPGAAYAQACGVPTHGAAVVDGNPETYPGEWSTATPIGEILKSAQVGGDHMGWLYLRYYCLSDTEAELYVYVQLDYPVYEANPEAWVKLDGNGEQPLAEFAWVTNVGGQKIGWEAKLANPISSSGDGSVSHKIQVHTNVVEGGEDQTAGTVKNAVCFTTYCQPESVALTGFSVSPGKGGVQLNWTTGNEVNNLGFNVYRSKRDDVTTAVKVNGDFIFSKALGQVVGADYEYTDTSASQWWTYHYWLQDVGQGGSKHYLGSGSWHMPKALRVYPASGSKPVGEGQRFNATFRDRDQDLAMLYLLLNDSPEVAGGMMVRYDVSRNLMALYDERIPGWRPEAAPGAKGGDNCRYGGLRTAMSRVKENGEYKTVGWQLKFWKPSRGTHNIYIRAVDAPGNDTGWVLVGSWSVE